MATVTVTHRPSSASPSTASANEDKSSSKQCSPSEKFIANLTAEALVTKGPEGFFSYIIDLSHSESLQLSTQEERVAFLEQVFERLSETTAHNQEELKSSLALLEAALLNYIPASIDQERTEIISKKINALKFPQNNNLFEI